MNIQEHIPLARKTTIRIGGTARYYAELHTKEDCEQALQFAREKNLPLIPLGGGSNTLFADGEVEALVIRLQASDVAVDGNRVRVQAGENLAMLTNELAQENLDLSPLTGILGVVGGAIFGNAGQGAQGVWIDTYVESVTVLTPKGWQEFSKDDCRFGYRDSVFKHLDYPVIIWEAVLNVPSKPQAEVEAEVQRLLQKRIETQPHVKTAGSCFKSVGATPAWQLIDAAGLRGTTVGGVSISEKHANFLINDGSGTFADAVNLVQKIEESVGEPLDVEMRFVKEDGSLAF